MAMRLKSIKFWNFRNYESFDLDDIKDITILVGENAVGKTNIIEGVQLLTSLSSFRHAPIGQLLRRGNNQGRLEAFLCDDQRQLDLELLLEGQTRKYRLNGKGKRAADLKGLLPAVTFTPDDLNLIKGSPGGRRHALDELGSQVSSHYHAVIKDFEKILHHKNHLLKEEANPTLLDSIDELFIVCGATLVCYRAALSKKLFPYMKEEYARLASEESLECFYVPSWIKADEADITFTKEEAREALAQALSSHRNEEIASHKALVGPQADRIWFEINGLDAGLYASQGQQRSLVLAWKLAEASVIEDILDKKPVLLLDDVMSELDESRREALFTSVISSAQSFITTANLAYFNDDMLEKAQVINLPIDRAGGM